MLKTRLVAVVASVAFILGATLAPGVGSATDDVAQWRFLVGETALTDACSNVLLFVPFGLAVALMWRRAAVVSVALTTVAGLSLSLLIEVLQSQGLPPGRFATIADLLSNGSGALIGALTAVNRASLSRPSVATALRLAFAWTAGAMAAVVATAWLLSSQAIGGRSSSLVSGEVAVLRRGSIKQSALPNASGFAWFAGLVDSVAVLGVPIPYVGTGPVRVEAAWTSAERESARQSHELTLTVRGRNPLPGIYPLLFVHEPHRRTYAAMVAQRDRDLVVVTARLGDAFGLRMPMAVLPDAFAGLVDARGIEFGTPVDPRLQVQASASSAELSLVAHSAFVQPALADSSRLLITPSLGWMLVLAAPVHGRWWQSLATVLWLTLLVLPACYWSGHGEQRSVPRAVFVTLTFSATCEVASRLFGIASFPWWQWVAIAVAALGGLLIARYRQRSATSPGG